MRLNAIDRASKTVSIVLDGTHNATMVIEEVEMVNLRLRTFYAQDSRLAPILHMFQD